MIDFYHRKQQVDIYQRHKNNICETISEGLIKWLVPPPLLFSEVPTSVWWGPHYRLVRAPLLFSGTPTTVSGAPLLLVGQTPTNRFPCRGFSSRWK